MVLREFFAFAEVFLVDRQFASSAAQGSWSARRGCFSQAN